MIDREKVIKGLECCLTDGRDSCKKCYQEGPGFGIACKQGLMRDALELLKGQEPRVLTLEEVQNDCPDYVYLEWQNCCVCCIKDGGESNKKAVYFACGIEGYYYQFLWDSYGIRWRCWTAMPTDEQRKAVTWDAAD